MRATAAPARRPAPAAARRGSPRRGHQPREGTRERILAAALVAFADAGYEGAKTRDIAAAAGVNQGLITYHFASKEALWQAAVDRVFAELRESFLAAVELLAAVDARTRLRLMLRQFVRFSAAHPELHRLMVQEGKSDGPRLRWLIDRHVRPLFETSLGVVREAQQDGLRPHLSAVHLQYIFLGAAAHVFVVAPEFRRLVGSDPTTPEAVEEHATALAELFLGEPA